MAALCRACLASNVKMFNLEILSISQAYFELTGIMDVNTDSLICFMCAYMLRKFVRFKRKCLKADEILKEKPVSSKVITAKIKEHALGIPLESLSPMVITIEPDIVDQIDSIYVEDIKIESTTQDDEIKSEDELDLPDRPDSASDTLCETKDVESKDEVEKDKQEVDEPVKNEKRFAPSLIKAQKRSTLRNYSRNTKTDNEAKRKRKQSPIIKKPLRKRKAVLKNNNDNKDSSYNTDIGTEELEKKRKQGNVKFDDSYFDGFATLVSLTHEEAKKEVESRKESANYLNSPFKCNLCFKGFQFEKVYEYHMKKHSPESGIHECDLCHIRFASVTKLKIHKTAYHRWKFCCTLCPYVSHRKFQARIHRDLHKGVKVKCDICKMMFSDPNAMLKHKRKKHDSAAVCEICGSTFPTKRGLATHTSLLHSQDENEKKGPKCEECGVHFSTELAWKRHLVLSTRHGVSNGCDICGESFPDPDTLKLHSKTHNRVKYAKKLPGRCDFCDTWLESKADYKKHMTSQHPDSNAAKKIKADESLPFPCVCEFCGKGFRHPSFLLYHQRKHTGERPYVCKVCGKTFAFPATFSVHKRIHRTTNLPKRIFKCELCEKTLSSKSALTKHIKTAHLNIRPHKCNICGKSFPSPCDVKNHTNYVHNKMPWPKRDRRPRKKAIVEGMPSWDEKTTLQ